MNNHLASSFNTLRIFIATFVVALIITSCNNAKKNKEEFATTNEKDSILDYINLGSNKALSISDRLLLLNKAFKLTQQIKQDTIRIKRLTKLQWLYSQLNDSTNFRVSNKQARNLALKLEDTYRLSLNFWDLGVYLEKADVQDSAYYYLSKAQKYFIQLNETKRAGYITYDMARIQSEIKDYSGSEINTIKAIELLKPFDENMMLFRCYNLLGIVSKDLGEYKQSYQYYNEAEGYVRKLDSREFLELQLVNNIGVTNLKSGAIDNAKNQFKKIINFDSVNNKWPDTYARALNNYATAKYKNNEDDNIVSIIEEAIKIRDSLEDESALAGSYINLAEYYLFNKDSIKALVPLLKAKQNAEKSSNNERLLQSLGLLAQIDKNNAASYSKRYINLNDSLAHAERTLRNKFARIRFETDEVVAENIILASEKELWAGITVSVMLLFAASFVIISQRIKNQKLKFIQAQQKSDEKIFSLMLSEKQKLEEGKKIEQKRISEELHDGILGKMLGARMVLTGLNKKVDTDAITVRADAISALKDVESEVRLISHELSHAAYKDMHNFIRSISDLLENTGTTANISHTFNYDNEFTWDNLSGDIKINLYRIIQESVQNAIKHAQCKTINLDFSVENESLQVIISDDGVGFDLTKTKRNGIGMLNLKSRVNRLNGEWTIDSKLGEGTSVRLLIPITYFSKEKHNFDTLAN
ncbi:ATP-binding protein [Aurantibacter sp.]|uniref:sensor histidine kinase n=1 Tax=Aurantibacter sp. TaxID=2807103 RepID=UPI003265A7C9